jgi:hypothetical protein
MRLLPAYMFGLATILVACGPIDVLQAEDICLRDAQLAAQPRGEIGIGVGSGGVRGSFEMTVSSDYLLGRDPSEVFNACVYQKSGQFPTRPLYSRTDWKG